ncbi:MAG: PGF-CTERM sorting domain-containing protein [Methanothrix sp.]|nr:PGF-CTERM sorting domain-containing protein [Methanothrix sp.]
MKKIVSIMLVALMMLFTAAMVVSASENASLDTAEKNLSTAEHGAEEVKEAVSVVSENKTAETHEAEPAKAAENKTAEPATKPAPGFEGIFAIAGLLAVASLVLSRRE